MAHNHTFTHMHTEKEVGGVWIWPDSVLLQSKHNIIQRLVHRITGSPLASICIYNNIRLFMAPHLAIAQHAYKDIRICSLYHKHTHAHYKQMHYW